MITKTILFFDYFDAFLFEQKTGIPNLSKIMELCYLSKVLKVICDSKMVGKHSITHIKYYTYLH